MTTTIQGVFNIPLQGEPELVDEAFRILEGCEPLRNGASADALARSQVRLTGFDVDHQGIYLRQPTIDARAVVRAWKTLTWLNARYPTDALKQTFSGEGEGWQRLLASHELIGELEILRATLPEDLTRDRHNRIRWGEDGRIEVEFAGRIGKDGPFHDYIFTGGGPRVQLPGPHRLPRVVRPRRRHHPQPRVVRPGDRQHRRARRGLPV